MVEVIEEVGQRRFTVEEYHRMADAGVFAPGERVELIRGIVRKMVPKGIRHVMAVSKLISSFPVWLAGRASFCAQDPVKKAELHSEPEPDFTIYSNPDPYAYGSDRSSLLQVIEVADSSLDYDRNVKTCLYADMRVPEYWLINLIDNVLEVYRDPSGGQFQSRQILEIGEKIVPLEWPDLEIEVSELIPPA
jgi:Uma2 family endonuclease